ncbi:MAG: hypothetical protein F7O42_13715 [Opitutae bacterium]|nr:hypothetical protein [Opitutae bacterium]
MQSRRKFFLLITGCLAGCFRWVPSLLAKSEDSKKIAQGACELTTEAVDGPYYVDDVFYRSDISEERDGVPLTLRLEVLEKDTCRPIPEATVDVWHCDALGNYSGFPGADPDEFPNVRRGAKVTSDLRFCRGRQISDEEGQVTFQSIFPGWYTPRTVHIHLKVILNDREMLSTQIYFPQELNDAILDKEDPYKERGRSPYRNKNDGVIKRSGGSTNAWPTTERAGRSIVATQTIVVKKLNHG